MKITATELMKQLKFIQEEIATIHQDDNNKSYVLVEKVTDDNNKSKLVPLYAEEYNFLNNRNRINDLYIEERKIRNLLSIFNTKTLVIGYDFNINEGLVRLAQLKEEIKVLTNLARKSQYESTTNYRNNEVIIYKVSYDIDEAKNYLRKAQKEMSALQVAIDKTNLNSQIDIED